MKESGSDVATRSQKSFRPLRKYLWFFKKNCELPAAYSSPSGRASTGACRGPASMDVVGGHGKGSSWVPWASPGTETVAEQQGREPPSGLPATILPSCSLQPHKHVYGQTPGSSLPNHNTVLAMKQVDAMFLKHPTPLVGTGFRVWKNGIWISPSPLSSHQTT